MVPSAPLAARPDLAALLEGGAVALFLDFDGTLVALAETPEAIVVPAGLAAGLRALSDRLDGRLALVSGRGLTDLERHLGGRSVACAGSHGIARVLPDGKSFGRKPEELPSDALVAIRAFAEEYGFVLEEKPHGAALHYRGAPHLESRGVLFAAMLAGEHGLATKRGKCVVELVQPGVDKGGAVRAFMEIAPFAGARPVFIGDDVTDEDGFAAAGALGGFGVLVGEPRSTAAIFGLPDAAAVHDWLGL